MKLFGGREDPGERIRRLWENARALDGPGREARRAARLYTELLALVDESSPGYDVTAILRSRALAYRRLGREAAAVGDLTRELEIAQRRGDELRMVEVRRALAEAQPAGGEPAGGLWRGGSDFEAAFAALLARLADGDAETRCEAARLLGESPDARRRLAAIYAGEGGTPPGPDPLQRAWARSLAGTPPGSDPLQGAWARSLAGTPPGPDPLQGAWARSLAGRALGRRVVQSVDELLDAAAARVLYGIEAAFIACPCAHCGAVNRGIAAPPAGPRVPHHVEAEPGGAYAVPVLCDACSRAFYVVWEEDPR